MSKLSKTQCQILKAAASRSGGAILPLPDGTNLKGGALKATLASLVKRGLVAEKGKDRRPVITKAGHDVLHTDDRGVTAKPQSPTGRKQTGSGNRAETNQARILTALEQPQG
jgi:hypothetical protein